MDGAVIADERLDGKLDADVLGVDGGTVTGAGGIGVDPKGAAVVQVAADDGTGFADEDFAFLAVGGENGRHGQDVGVVFAGGGAEGDERGEVVRTGGHDAIRHAEPRGGAAVPDEFVALDLEAEGADAGGGIVPERDLGDDDLDADLGEDDIDLGDEFVDKPDVALRARHDDGVAAFLREDGEQGAELIGGFGLEIGGHCGRGRHRLGPCSRGDRYV